MIERRSAPRVRVSVPAEIAGETGARTLNISTAGIYLLTSTAPALGSVVSFSLIFDAGQPVAASIRGRGTVVRLEPRGQEFGVAVSIEAFGEAGHSPGLYTIPLSRA